MSGPEDVQDLHPRDGGFETVAPLGTDQGGEVLSRSRPTATGRIKHSADSLEADVERFTDGLRRKYPGRIARRPKAFKSRVVSLVKQSLPPYPKPSGRPRNLRVTRAAEMYVEQLREMNRGRRKRVTWIPIARACITGFDQTRSEYVRRSKLDTLRDAVYARRRARKSKKPSR